MSKPATYVPPAITPIGSLHELTLHKTCWKVTKKGHFHDLQGGNGLRRKFTYNCSI